MNSIFWFRSAHRRSNRAISLAGIVLIIGAIIPSGFTLGTRPAFGLPSEVSIQTSADDHGRKFFGESLLGVVIFDSSADPLDSDSIDVTIAVKDNSGIPLTTSQMSVENTF